MEFKTNNQNIVYLKWDNKEQVKAVSNLHIKLLPESVLSKLGYLFLSKFYYTKLTKHNLIDVYLYKQNEEFVGFISCTNKPFIFMKKGMKNNFLFIPFLLGLSIIFNPYRLISLLSYLSKMKKDSLMESLQTKYGNKMGEFLSFGILEEHRRTIDQIEEVSIPNVLMKLVLTHYKANNIQYVLIRILQTNVKAIKFFQKHAGVIIPSDVPNQVVIIIETSAIIYE